MFESESRWWFQISLIFTPIWGIFPIGRADFSDGLVHPPSRNDFCLNKTVREGREIHGYLREILVGEILYIPFGQMVWFLLKKVSISFQIWQFWVI